MSSSQLRQGGVFVLASLAAGVLHYLFQVVAARELDPALFAGFNGWFADVSVCFVAGALLQYAANFAPARIQRLRTVSLLFAAILAVFTWRWLAGEGLGLERGAILVATACMFAWLQGQAQIRLAFLILAGASVAFAGAKLLLVFVPLGAPGEVERFALALFLAYLPGMAALTLYLWSSPPPATLARPSWAAPVILSVAATVIPQFDMVLMHHTQSEAMFQEFVHASLFYRGIYFVVFIFAQWLLPHQIHGRARTQIRAVMITGAAAVAFSAVLQGLSPWVSRAVFKWESEPQGLLVFWSCVNMSLLTLVFLWIQEMCAQRRTALAAVAVAALSIEAAVQWTLRLPAPVYLPVMSAAQIGVITLVHALGRRAKSR